MPSKKYKVKINLKNFAKDSKVTIPDLGTFKNGSTSEVDKLHYDRFLRNHPNAKDLDSDGTIEITSKNLDQQREEVEAEVEAEVEKSTTKDVDEKES